MECINCSSVHDEKNLFYLLKCGHPLCKTCLTTQSQNGFNCMSCKAEVSSLDSLAKYLLIYPMMEDHPNQIDCIICKESHHATKFCLDCNAGFCEGVAESHLRYPFFRKHTIVTTEELVQYQMGRQHLSFLHHKSCVQHDRPFEFLDLEKETHNEMLCSECLTGTHTSLVGLGDCAVSLLQKKLDHIRELGAQGTQHLNELREEEESFTSRLEKLEESKARSLSEIQRLFGSLHETLQTRQHELEREVEELSKSAGFALSEERERSRVWQGQLSLLEKCMEEITPNSLISSSPSSSEPSFISQKALMVDACLLEDALRNSLSSSKASSSLTDLQSHLKVSQIQDRIQFSFRLSLSLDKNSTGPTSPSLSPSSEGEETLLHCLSTMCSVTSTSPSMSDWSKNKVQSVMTFYSKGNGANQLSNPYGMTYSPLSRLCYVTDCSNKCIQVFWVNPWATQEGRLKLEYLPRLGSTRLASTSFTDPPVPPQSTSICYHDGQLFIADCNHHRIQVWRAEDGSFLRMIGTGSAGNAVGQFYSPWGCTVYQNHLFVSDHYNYRIQKISLSDFSVVKVIGAQGNGLGQLANPKEISVFNGKLYVADSGNHRISVFDPESGAALSVIGPSLPNDGNLSGPSGLLFSHNLLFVSSQHRISVFDSNHNYLYSFGSLQSGTEIGQLSSPQGMVMVDQKLFVCETGNGRVQVFEQKPN